MRGQHRAGLVVGNGNQRQPDIASQPGRMGRGPHRAHGPGACRHRPRMLEEPRRITVDPHADQLPPQPRCPLSHQGIPTDEIDAGVEIEEAIEPSLEGIDVVGRVTPVGQKETLDALDRVGSVRADPMGFARFGYEPPQFATPAPVEQVKLKAALIRPSGPASSTCI